MSAAFRFKKWWLLLPYTDSVLDHLLVKWPTEQLDVGGQCEPVNAGGKREIHFSERIRLRGAELRSGNLWIDKSDRLRG